MELRRIPCSDPHMPGEPVCRRALEAEGFEVVSWRDPADRVYEAHSHGEDERLCVLRGRIVLKIDGHDFALGPGDQLELPRGTVHSAQAGPDGALYLIARRRSDA